MLRPHFKFAFLVLGLAAFSGCDIDGALHVQQSTTLKDKKGRAVILAAGQTYKASIAKDGDMINFHITTNGKESVLKLSPPPRTTIPKRDGEVIITAARSGQPVDIDGKLVTTESDGPDMRDSQTCSAIAQIRVCQQVPQPTPAGQPPVTREECHFESQTVTGQQEIEVHDHISTTTATVDLLVPNSQTLVGEFNGDRSSSSRVITWAGRCVTAYDDPRDRWPGGGWAPRPGPGGRPPRH